jgi:hypothetical protein
MLGVGVFSTTRDNEGKGMQRDKPDSVFYLTVLVVPQVLECTQTSYIFVFLRDFHVYLTK